MVSPRNRERPALEERLLRFAEEARAAASFIAPGREHEEPEEGSQGRKAGECGR